MISILDQRKFVAGACAMLGLQAGSIAIASELQKHWVGCFGNGGQRLFVFPDLELIVVTTFGNLTPDQWVAPARILRDAVLPSLLRT